ncbi:hypothetical protein AMTRI_Chr03g138160 [Amborella trichopoda]
MLQIRLNNKGPASDGSPAAKGSVAAENVTVACPDHLVLADLPVAKCLGNLPNATAVAKTVGRRSRRLLGERIHFCVRCDFPIAIYGRLSPCEHAFCLACARSDSSCYLCDERIQKIQTIKMLEGIFICAAPHCLKSFLKKHEFETHITETHTDLLHTNQDREENPSENDSFAPTRPPSADTSSKPPPTPSEKESFSGGKRVITPPHNTLLPNDREDKNYHRYPSKDPPPLKPPPPQKSPFSYPRNEPDRAYNRAQFDRPPIFRRDSDHQGPPLNYPYPYPPILPDGPHQPYFNPNFDASRHEFTSEGGSEQGSLLGFPPGQGPMGFQEGYSRPWNMGFPGMPFEGGITMGQQGVLNDGYFSPVDSQARGVLQPPPPLPPHGPVKRGKFSGNEGGGGREGQGYGWQGEKRGHSRGQD